MLLVRFASSESHSPFAFFFGGLSMLESLLSQRFCRNSYAMRNKKHVASGVLLILLFLVFRRCMVGDVRGDCTEVALQLVG